MQDIFESKTAYEWCLELMIRPLDLGGFITSQTESLDSVERRFFEVKLYRDQFAQLIAGCKVKPNSIPRKSPKYLEYRMYGLVLYNISPIQQGIQFGHAVQEYNNKISELNDKPIDFTKWANVDKTFMVMDGGSSITLLDQFYKVLEMDITAVPFHEPDLGGIMTSFVFLADERAFNKKLYPFYEKTPYPWFRRKPRESELRKWEQENDINYLGWVDKIGGFNNVKLKEFIDKLRFA